MRIQNNITAVNSHRQYGINQGNLSRGMERLSSGLRVNRAADDAAGLAISEKMRAQIRGLNQASRNVQDANSLIQVADGGLQTVSDILQRMRELAVQAATDTNDFIDREALNLEFRQLSKEIDVIADTTEFNGVFPLRGHYMGQPVNAVWSGTELPLPEISFSGTNPPTGTLAPLNIVGAQAAGGIAPLPAVPGVPFAPPSTGLPDGLVISPPNISFPGSAPAGSVFQLQLPASITTINVPTGQTLMITGPVANNITINGGGNVRIVGSVSANVTVASDINLEVEGSLFGPGMGIPNNGGITNNGGNVLLSGPVVGNAPITNNNGGAVQVTSAGAALSHIGDGTGTMLITGANATVAANTGTMEVRGVSATVTNSLGGNMQITGASAFVTANAGNLFSALTLGMGINSATGQAVLTAPNVNVAENNGHMQITGPSANVGINAGRLNIVGGSATVTENTASGGLSISGLSATVTTNNGVAHIVGDSASVPTNNGLLWIIGNFASVAVNNNSSLIEGSNATIGTNSPGASALITNPGDSATVTNNHGDLQIDGVNATVTNNHATGRARMNGANANIASNWGILHVNGIGSTTGINHAIGSIRFGVDNNASITTNHGRIEVSAGSSITTLGYNSSPTGIILVESGGNINDGAAVNSGRIYVEQGANIIIYENGTPETRGTAAVISRGISDIEVNRGYVQVGHWQGEMVTPPEGSSAGSGTRVQTNEGGIIRNFSAGLVVYRNISGPGLDVADILASCECQDGQFAVNIQGGVIENYGTLNGGGPYIDYVGPVLDPPLVNYDGITNPYVDPVPNQPPFTPPRPGEVRHHARQVAVNISADGEGGGYITFWVNGLAQTRTGEWAGTPDGVGRQLVFYPPDGWVNASGRLVNPPTALWGEGRIVFNAGPHLEIPGVRYDIHRFSRLDIAGSSGTSGLKLMFLIGGGFTVQSGANQGQTTIINFRAMNAEMLSSLADACGGCLCNLHTANVLTRHSASCAIGVVDGALNAVSMYRAELGAIFNRLDFKMHNLNNQSENVQAAESRIRDADMAREMTDQARNNILMQASTAMLAQANALPQGVLQLLG